MRLTSILLIVSGLILFLLNWIFEKEMSISKQYISDFVHSKYGFMTTEGFLFIGSGMLLSSNILNGSLTIFEMNILIYSILFISLAFFPANKANERDLIGSIHKIIATVCFPYFIIFTLIHLWNNQTDYALLILTADALSLLGLVLMGINLFNLKGIYQRVCILSQVLLILQLLLRKILLNTMV